MGVKISVDTMRALCALPWFCSSFCAKSILIRLAEQPMPDKLYVTTSERMPKWLSTIAHKDGVGEKRLQLMMRMSMSLLVVVEVVVVALYDDDK